jgi:hypothetical protein
MLFQKLLPIFYGNQLASIFSIFLTIIKTPVHDSIVQRLDEYLVMNRSMDELNNSRLHYLGYLTCGFRSRIHEEPQTKGVSSSIGLIHEWFTTMGLAESQSGIEFEDSRVLFQR